MEDMRDARQIVDQTNELAREFSSILGHDSPKTLRFYLSNNHKDILCWKMASHAMERLTKAKISDALEEVLERINRGRD